MKHLIIFFAGLLFAHPVFSQEGEPVVLNVFYRFIHVNDTNNRDKPLVEDMLLLLGQQESKYIRKPAKKPAPPANTGGPVTTIVAVGKPLAVVNGPGITDTELFQHPSTGKMNITASLGMQDYLINLDLPKIEWIISQDTRTIGSYTCQKATGKYAGRTYIAWFAPELPFQNGPWKLSGLPGLILEAEDEKKEVSFILTEVVKEWDILSTVTNRRRLVKATEKDYLRARDAFMENPAASMQAQLPATAPKVQVAYRDASGNSTIGDKANELIENNRKKVKASNNNPVELK